MCITVPFLAQLGWVCQRLSRWAGRSPRTMAHSPNHAASPRFEGAWGGTTGTRWLGVCLGFWALTSSAQLPATVPVAPGAFSVLELAWDASADTNVAGYILYYGPVDGRTTNQVVLPNVCQTTLTNLPAASHFFYVTAFDAAGGESDPSNVITKASKLVPAATRLVAPSARAATAPFLLSWPGQANQSYQVQYKDDLRALTWSNLSLPVRSDGSLCSWTDATAAGRTSRYYRVVSVQP